MNCLNTPTAKTRLLHLYIFDWLSKLLFTSLWIHNTYNNHLGRQAKNMRELSLNIPQYRIRMGTLYEVVLYVRTVHMCSTIGEMKCDTRFRVPNDVGSLCLSQMAHVYSDTATTLSGNARHLPNNDNDESVHFQRRRNRKWENMRFLSTQWCAVELWIQSLNVLCMRRVWLWNTTCALSVSHAKRINVLAVCAAAFGILKIAKTWGNCHSIMILSETRNMHKCKMVGNARASPMNKNNSLFGLRCTTRFICDAAHTISHSTSLPYEWKIKHTQMSIFGLLNEPDLTKKNPAKFRCNQWNELNSPNYNDSISVHRTAKFTSNEIWRWNKNNNNKKYSHTPFALQQ